VWGDDQKLAETDVMTFEDPAQELEVDVTGVDVLRLVVTDGGDGNGDDHANWADAQVQCGDPDEGGADDDAGSDGTADDGADGRADDGADGTADDEADGTPDDGTDGTADDEADGTDGAADDGSVATADSDGSSGTSDSGGTCGAGTAGGGTDAPG